MIGWLDQDKGPICYGDRRIRETMADLMGKDQAEEFRRRWEANVVDESAVREWKGWGLNSVRLSINYHMLSPREGAYLDTGWEKIDRLLAWCKANGLWVILCLHAAPGSQSGEVMSDGCGAEAKLWTEPGRFQPWTIKLWKEIARRYAGEPAIAGFDLLDEPMPPKGHEKDVRAFYVELTKAIREVDARHLIFAEGLEYAGSPAGMQALEPAWDKSLVFTFHKYWDKNDQASIQAYLDLSHRNQRPLWNGESGENTNAWGGEMVALCEENGIGWNWWTSKKVGLLRQPYTIHAPASYQKILDYAAGKGPKPSRAEAARILLSLADNAATGKCSFNRETVESVFKVARRSLAHPSH
jgi:hypothetical protein